MYFAVGVFAFAVSIFLLFGLKDVHNIPVKTDADNLLGEEITTIEEKEGKYAKFKRIFKDVICHIRDEKSIIVSMVSTICTIMVFIGTL